jgi:hypothetical protein
MDYIPCATKGIVFDEDNWSIFEGEKGIPQQNNGYDCGIFVLMFMDFISRDISVLNLHCNEMELWRKKIALTIIRGSLLMSQKKKNQAPKRKERSLVLLEEQKVIKRQRVKMEIIDEKEGVEILLRLGLEM